MIDVRDRVILVTGGAAGAGRGVVEALIDAGATVVATVHRRPPQLPEGVELEIADLLDVAAVEPLVARVTERHGRIDGLVCLVGGFKGGAFIQSERQTWQELIDLNLHSAVGITRAALPGMIARGYGRIVTIGSRPAVDPAPNSSAYAAAKAAVIAMTRGLARELRGSGVTANCVLPSTIDTPQNRELLPRADPSKWVTPRQLGQVVAFLCSEPAGAIRGAAIPVYGDT
jgi:NAD(P)-dependent dehydrogenase (short-subunit alcohol dehydrogenase family)